mmetsp:Transcript_12954/g.32689  ORF Transcript_12954/g.32689 Transcript_12954/m.32689 type:complete len:231 (-) Transcript_12954:1129-1821(-)
MGGCWAYRQNRTRGKSGIRIHPHGTLSGCRCRLLGNDTRAKSATAVKGAKDPVFCLCLPSRLHTTGIRTKISRGHDKFRQRERRCPVLVNSKSSKVVFQPSCRGSILSQSNDQERTIQGHFRSIGATKGLDCLRAGSRRKAPSSKEGSTDAFHPRKTNRVAQRNKKRRRTQRTPLSLRIIQCSRNVATRNSRLPGYAGGSLSSPLRIRLCSPRKARRRREVDRIRCETLM